MTVTQRFGAVLLEGGAAAALAGHVAGGEGGARVVVLRTGTTALLRGTATPPPGRWRSPLLPGDGLRHDAAGCATVDGVHHGVNARSVLVACAPGGPAARAGLAGALLAAAADVDEAAALLEAAASGLDSPDRVWIAGPGRSLLVELGSGSGIRVATVHASGGGGIDALRAALRDREPGAAVSAIAARLAPSGPELLVCLGPLRAGVFVRQWPGIPAPPPLDGGEERAPLGELAAALALRDGDGTAPALAALAAAEAAALAEGADAERQAAIMDAAGDDHGAEVRRALAQAHAAELVQTAMRGLLGCGAAADPTV